MLARTSRLVELLCLAATATAVYMPENPAIRCSDIFNSSTFTDFVGGKAKGVVIDGGINVAIAKSRIQPNGSPFSLSSLTGIQFIGCRGDQNGDAIEKVDTVFPSGSAVFLSSCAPESFFCEESFTEVAIDPAQGGGTAVRQVINFGTRSQGTGGGPTDPYAQLYMCNGAGLDSVADCAAVPAGQAIDPVTGQVPCCDAPGGKCSTPDISHQLGILMCLSLGYTQGSEEFTQTLPAQQIFCPDGIASFDTTPITPDFTTPTSEFARSISCNVDFPIPSPPAAPPPLTITGDPHFYGGDGDRFDFAGVNNTVYSLFSASRLALNALFVKTTFVMGYPNGPTCPYCKLKTVHGSFVKVAYFRALTAGGKTALVEYRTDEPSHALLSVEDKEGDAPLVETEVKVSKFKTDSVQYTVDDVTVHLTRKHYREAAVTVSNGDFELQAVSMHLPWAEQNKYQKRLDVSIKVKRDVRSLKVPLHGLVGQTFDGDGVAVDGALDDYSGKEVFTKAMGEGAIEGVAADYVISRADPFSTAFKYNRFGASSAAPRDATKLTGLHRKVKHLEHQTAGANGDDTLSLEAMEAGHK